MKKKSYDFFLQNLLNQRGEGARAGVWELHDGVRRVSGLRREPIVTMENPTLIPTSH